MKKLNKLFLNFDNSLLAVKHATETNISLKIMSEQRSDWLIGEWDALIFTIDISCRVLEDAEKQLWIDRDKRDRAIEKLSENKKIDLIQSLISSEIPF